MLTNLTNQNSTPQQHIRNNLKTLIETASLALEKLNSLGLKKDELTSLLLSFDNNDLLRGFVCNLNQSQKTYRKSLKKWHRNEKKQLVDQMLTNQCKLRAKKKKEKTLIKDQLFAIEQSKDETPRITDDSEATTSDQTSSKRIPLSRHSKKIAKLSSKDANSSNQLPLQRSCYVCRLKYTKLHHYYDQMCPSCAEFNYAKRTQKCDFNGRIALVTGCRIKIGYEIALYFLRNNCKVIGTTRFPKDAFERFSKENDFDSWKDNLVIYPLNLRNLSVLDQFIKHLYNTIPKLDILINNAAQTIRRAPIYYQNLLVNESKPLDQFNNAAVYKTLPQDFGNLNCVNSNGYQLQIQNDDISTEITVEKNIAENISGSVLESLIPLTASDLNPKLEYFPQGVVDKDNQQVDLSVVTSWNKNIEDVDFVEFAETQVINSWAPWQLNSKLKDLMTKSENAYTFIINVSSMEGKFNRFKKSTHPHTNMSKASLNMMTRTCGSHYARSNILMNSVDTGWVSEMLPSELLSEKKTVPLDEIDGAMRVLDPIIQAINNNEALHSTFLKDYKPSEW